jgi:hypothetical protein
MVQTQRQSAVREVINAIKADEQANTNYYEVIKSLISDGLDKSEAKVDSSGLKEIDAAWIKLNDTNKKLRRAYMKLYDASH